MLKGGKGADELIGDAGNDRLDGGDGNDESRGALGDDLIVGGAGADEGFGSAGSDTLNGGTGNDRCRVGTTVTASSAVQAATIFGKGWAGDDTLDAVDGVEGNDFANGGDGAADACTADRSRHRHRMRGLTGLSPWAMMVAPLPRLPA